MPTKSALFILLLLSAAACHDDSPPAKSPDQAPAGGDGSTIESEHEKFKKKVHETGGEVEQDLNKVQKDVTKSVKGAGKELGVSSDVVGSQPDGG